MHELQRSVVIQTLFLLSLAPELASAQCTAKVQFEGNSHWYQRCDVSLGWHAAAAYCEERSGYLATITSASEDAFAYSTFGVDAPSVVAVWLGGSDESVEGTFSWITGEPFAYTNWATVSNEPNNCSGIEHYVAYFVPPDARAGLWNDFGTSEDPPGTCGCGTCEAGVFAASLLCEFDCERACGDPAAPEGSVSASDALFMLTAAVGQASCALCTCDVDGSGAIVASDALRTLAFAVGQPVTLECP